MSNPFNDALDWALQGKRVRVYTDHGVVEGWVDRVHHNRGSLVMHDCYDEARDADIGSTFVRTADRVDVLKPRKRIEFRAVGDLQAHPAHPEDFEPRDAVVRRCYRNQFAGGYPVVREDGTIINGHKRIAAARLAGMDKHPVEVVDVTDEQADELFALAHRDEDEIGDAALASSEGSEDDAGGEQEPENPYAPTDFGTLEAASHQDKSVNIYLPDRALSHFEEDPDRIHVHEDDGEFYLAAGDGGDEWPHYAVTGYRDGAGASSTIGARGCDLLDVVPGDEIFAEPDGDRVRLDLRRIAERDQFVDLGEGRVYDYGSPQLHLPQGVVDWFEDADRVHVREAGDHYEIHAGEGPSQWPDYSATSPQPKLGAKVVRMVDLEEDDQPYCRGDRDRGMVELYPPGVTPDGQEDEDSAGVVDDGETEAASDGGAVAFTDWSATDPPDDECENCGSELVNGYAAVFESEDEEKVRACPNCEDKVRERDGTVRLKRRFDGDEDGDSA